jgi:hypothetical protein
MGKILPNLNKIEPKKQTGTFYSSSHIIDFVLQTELWFDMVKKDPVGLVR